jgi:hypothetical protein
METFTLIVFGGLALALLGLLALGAWNPRSIGELTDRSDERRLADQAMIEEHDVDEMVDAQNANRSRRGKDPLTEADFRARADAQQRASIERAERAKGSESS